MAIPIWLKGVCGTNGLQVDNDGAALVSLVPHPPRITAKHIPLRQHLTDDGLVTDGTNQDMKRVGTLAAPIDFWIPADGTNDRYITHLSFLIADAAAKPNQFGAITALTNGCNLFYKHALAGDVTIHDALMTNFEFMRLALGQPAFGSAADAFRAKNVIGVSDAYIPVLDLRIFSPDGFGIKLDAGSTQRLTLQVRDDTTGVDGFDCIAYGFDRLP